MAIFRTGATPLSGPEKTAGDLRGRGRLSGPLRISVAILAAAGLAACTAKTERAQNGDARRTHMAGFYFRLGREKLEGMTYSYPEEAKACFDSAARFAPELRRAGDSTMAKYYEKEAERLSPNGKRGRAVAEALRDSARKYEKRFRADGPDGAPEAAAGTGPAAPPSRYKP